MSQNPDDPDLDTLFFFKMNNLKFKAGEASLDKKSCCKISFKGLVNLDTTRVCGIGVAICDRNKDIPLLTLSKPLKNVENGMMERHLDIMGLIEGLEAALGLGLREVTLLCHDLRLCQYVAGIQKPTDSKIAALVEQVNVLQKKFTYCKPIVAHDNYNLVLKLARDAIGSQVKLHAESSTSKRQQIETCEICFEDTEPDQMFNVDVCLHRYCFSCMKQHVQVKFLNGMVVKCPQEGCNSEVKIDSCGKFLASELVDIMKERIKEATIPVTDKVYCPNPRCSTLMSKSNLKQYKAFDPSGQLGARKCTKCHLIFCVNCKVPWHYNNTCDNYKSLNPYPQEETMLRSLAEKKHWRQCVQCNQMIELAAGCYHIICRCGYQFCYTCGAEWKNKNATCKCPIWDERYIIDEEWR